MKVLRSYTLDIEVAESLKNEANASLLINNLLKQHYGSTKENIAERIKEMNKELDVIHAQSVEIHKLEDEKSKQKALQDKKDALVKKHRKEFEIEREKLAEKVKKEELSFEEFRKATQILKDNYGF
jgi:flagellar hook-associated protein FlgK